MSTQSIVFISASIAIALSLSSLIGAVREWRDRHTLRLVARFSPESWLIKYSLWTESDGEPMNEWADEMVRRDDLAAALKKGGAA